MHYAIMDELLGKPTVIFGNVRYVPRTGKKLRAPNECQKATFFNSVSTAQIQSPTKMFVIELFSLSFSSRGKKI
jgi:hypothetical protein